FFFFFFFQAEDGIRDGHVTEVQTCALPIYRRPGARAAERRCRAARGPDRAGPGAGAHLHVAENGGADGRGVQEPAITTLGGESSAFLSAGSVDITPDRPLPLAGYVNRRAPSRGVADPLELNALLLRAPGQSVAILTADLLFVTTELKAQLLDAVGARLGLDEASLLVAASHTHTAPAVDSSKPQLGVCDPDYAALVAGRAAELLGRLASLDPVPCHVDYRTGAADHAINRRRPGWRGVRSAPNPAWAGGLAERVVGVARGALRTRRPVAPACKIERIPVSALFAGSSGRGRHLTLQRLSFDPGLHLAAVSAEPVTAYGAMVRSVFRG